MDDDLSIPHRVFFCLLILWMASGLLAGAVFGYQRGQRHVTSKIGANEVPVLFCEEDELIGFVQEGQPPYDLGCVHIDSLSKHALVGKL